MIGVLRKHAANPTTVAGQEHDRGINLVASHFRMHISLPLWVVTQMHAVSVATTSRSALPGDRPRVKALLVASYPQHSLQCDGWPSPVTAGSPVPGRFAEPVVSLAVGARLFWMYLRHGFGTGSPPQLMMPLRESSLGPSFTDLKPQFGHPVGFRSNMICLHSTGFLQAAAAGLAKLAASAPAASSRERIFMTVSIAGSDASDTMCRRSSLMGRRIDRVG
jgi:hypothetical protein